MGDYEHAYRIEYHNDVGKTHLILAIKDKPEPKECHIVEVDSKWEAMLQDSDKVHLITDEIYRAIVGGAAVESTLTIRQLQAAYGDYDATRECFQHIVKIFNYIPSDAILNMA